ncbi:MAG: DUF4412 domain-containing protein [Bacteroidetes bacterium]|nr:DUF4412 domain-containing protein [Bacteroidota bacterium]
MKIRKCFLLFLLLLLLFPNYIFAGWIIKEVTKDAYGEERSQTIYIQNNIMKTVDNDEISIYNLNSNKICLINPIQKVFWEGTIDEYLKGMDDYTLAMVEDELSKLTPEEKETYKALHSHIFQEAEIVEQNFDVQDSLKVEIKKLLDKDIIAKHQTQRYQLWLNDSLIYDYWVSSSINLYKDFNFEKFYKLIEKMSGQLSETGYESSPEFKDFLKKGYSLKTIDAENNITETLNIEKKQLSTAVFNVPQNYTKLEFVEFSKSKILNYNNE